MRVISGSARGTKLFAPAGLNTRPTADRIKESLFNIIANDLYDICFLDLFSGSGAIGIEALSRGAVAAVFVDSSKDSIDTINRNLIKTRFSDKAVVIESDIGNALRRLFEQKRKFDIIFMDPPYNKALVNKALNYIVDFKLLNDGGYIIAEQSYDEEPPNISGLSVFKVKGYKVTKMTFLRYMEDYYE